MMENWIEIRLNRIAKKLAALQTASFDISNSLEFFIQDESQPDIDSVIYGQESLEGVSELIGDVKDDIEQLVYQIEEQRTATDSPHTETQGSNN